VFTKPAVPGRVKTRLQPALGAERAAALHAAFLADLLARLDGSGIFELRLAWALDAGEEPPPSSVPAVRQRGEDLGARLHAALADAARTHARVAAVGSDHPTLPRERVEEAFARLEQGADLVLGPALDGGYTLVALRGAAVDARLFTDIPWSGPRVLACTLERARELVLRVELLPMSADVDTPEDLERLRAELRDPATPACPRTAALLAAWSADEPGASEAAGAASSPAVPV